MNDIEKERAGWHKITAVMDSGSAVNAMPADAVPFVDTKPGAASQAGMTYRGAGGELIPNEGEKDLVMKTAEGQTRRTKWQICPVRRPLISVAKVNEASNLVLLSTKNPHVRNLASGQITKFR